MLAVCLEIMQTGMAIDIPHLQSLSARCISLMDTEARKAASHASHPFNPNSDDQVREIVYGELGFKPTRYTKESRSASTTDKELSKINHPIIKPILEYRKIAKIRDSYAEKLPRYAQIESGIPTIHPTVRLTGTDTGRLKVVDPPLQTLPVRSEIGREIRNAFISRPDTILLLADLSQIEMRVLAHISQCRNLISLFQSNGDIHTDTAVLVFGVDRERAKEDKYHS